MIDDRIIPNAAVFTMLLSLAGITFGNNHNVSIRGYVGGSSGGPGVATMALRLKLTPTVPPGPIVILSGAAQTSTITGFVSAPVNTELLGITGGTYDIALEIESVGAAFTINAASNTDTQGASLGVEEYLP